MLKALSRIALLYLIATFPAQADELRAGDLVVKNLNNTKTRFTIITNDGYVRFTAGGEWKTISAVTGPPIVSMVFQIENPADWATRDSTNLIVGFVISDGVEGRRALARMCAPYGAAVVNNRTHGTWNECEQEVLEGATQYRIIDGIGTVGGGVVTFARIAWPRLPDNERGYDAAMMSTFRELLGSIEAHKGPYRRDPDEVAWRHDPP